ncbi:MAG: histidine phosphatase family protein [Ardenticatenaceae bacterium]|nr:histidine phosphatase family protein [Anaerolineales bacterium]MCB8923125.1 histidine phosphatase family protein [Ardenticatenaceae bacterium]MCB8990008.1 histidine phosphatase family protein [Ardenticatenaceae bacterium]
MSKVWLIRHGESVSNANLPTSDPAQSALTEKGFFQAEQIVSAFTDRPDLVVVSPYLRARQTAVPTINHFTPVPVAEWPVHEFTYLAPSRYNGTTGVDRAPYAHAYWQQNDPTYKDKGEGESFAELLERVWAFVAQLRKHPAPFLAVFSHGMFLRAFFWVMLVNATQATPEMMQRYGRYLQSVWMPNAAICKVHIADDGVYFTGFDTAHLNRANQSS